MTKTANRRSTQTRATRTATRAKATSRASQRTTSSRAAQTRTARRSNSRATPYRVASGNSRKSSTRSSNSKSTARNGHVGRNNSRTRRCTTEVQTSYFSRKPLTKRHRKSNAASSDVSVSRKHTFNFKVAKSQQRYISKFFTRNLGMLSLVALVVVGCFSVTVAHAQLVGSQQKLDDLRTEVLEAEADRAILEEKVELSSSPMAIVERANELGMVRPSERIYLEPVTLGKPVAPTQDLVEPSEPKDMTLATNRSTISDGNDLSNSNSPSLLAGSTLVVGGSERLNE